MSVFVSLLALGQGIVTGAGQAPSTNANLDNYYDRRRETTFSGTVSGKTKGKVPGKSQGMSILVRSGKTLREVEVGPAWYVGRQSAAVNLGDKIKVTAVPYVVGRQRVYLARQIVRGRNVLALRDSQGVPYWSARRASRVAVNNSNGAAQSMANTYTGTITGINNYNMNGETYSGYVVNTPNGPMNVAMAPDWYWNNQGANFQVGQQLTFTGALGARNVGGVILADSAYYGGGAFILRPGGFPVYGGFQPINALGGGVPPLGAPGSRPLSGNP